MNTHKGSSKQTLSMFIVLAICLALLVACSSMEQTRAPTPTRIYGKGRMPSSSLPSPSVAAAPPSGPHYSVDRFLASMDLANIAFNCPQTINLHETAQIQLLLSLQKPIDELRAAIAAGGEREGARVKVSNRMEARLSGPNFQITAITTEEQAVGSIDTVEWKWEIKPTAPGHHSLHLTLTALLNIDGATTRRAVRTFDRMIDVEVTTGQRVTEFFRKNWQWLWAAVLLPVAGWLWKRWKNKNVASK